jgi:hypothetical protein
MLKKNSFTGRVAAVVAGLIGMSLNVATPVAAEQWNFENEVFATPTGYHRVIVDQASESAPQVFSYISSWVGSTYNRARNCLDKNPCDGLSTHNGYSFEGNLVMGLCSNGETQYCLESVAISDELATGPAKFVRYVVAELPQPGSWGSFNGSDFKSSSIWEVPHANGETESFLVTAAVQFMASPFDSEIYPQISSRVERFSYHDDPLETPIAEVTSDGLGLFNKREGPIGIGFGTWRKCAWSESGVCGLREDFSRPTQVKLSLRLPAKKVIPYLSTTIKNAEMSYVQGGKSSATITVGGESDWVPSVFVHVKDSEFPKAVNDYPVNLNLGRWGVMSNYAPINALRPFVADKATAKKSIWGFQTLGKYSPSTDTNFEFWKSKTMRDCISQTPGLVGSTSTNAMAYGEGPPIFDGKELKASVAGMHFNSDGEVEQGRFEIRISKKLAACLYGFRDAPVKATISIVGDNETPKVAITSVSQTGDSIFLRASGFTFSTAHIAIRLTQTKISVTCRAGSKVKKISGTNPKCPKGYHRTA